MKKLEKSKLAGSAFAAIALLAVAGCSERLDSPTPLGEATRHNFAVQVVNPEGSDIVGPIETSGAIVDRAVRNYELGHVKRPEEVSTTED